MCKNKIKLQCYQTRSCSTETRVLAFLTLNVSGIPYNHTHLTDHSQNTCLKPYKSVVYILHKDISYAKADTL